jgi:hypothetical protein
MSENGKAACLGAQFLEVPVMSFPDFFDQAPSISVHDPLAAMLGAPVDGMMTYVYADAVKSAGHSCPTVAGSWLMARRALAVLWAGETPQRGGVVLGFPHGQGEGVTGVIAAIAGLVCGAAGEGGFKGIAGNYSRKDLLRFGRGGDAVMTASRLDDGRVLRLDYRPERVPADPQMRDALQAISAGDADPAQRSRFAALWQDRVRRILTEHHDDPELVTHAFF